MELVLLLILIIFANGAPIIVHKLIGQKYNYPMDFGVKFFDQRRILGPSKTIRGVIASILLTTLVAPLFGFSMTIGFLVGSGSMLGDLLTSFFKRRFGMVSSSMALGVDQMLESLLPLLACKSLLALNWNQISWLVFIFFVSCIVLSRILFKLGIREKPY
ncbi:MAG: CDP-archaeol synthase [Methylococcales bacterium]|jgi:hypothetical protein|nr:CDP-archaeol synthase [Methylococcales bacterium]